MMIKHCIIGAGVAGLFIALQLQRMNQPFMLLDQSPKPHTKLESTKPIEGQILEMGASVFHSHQYKLLWLIQKLGLYQQIRRLNSSNKEKIICDLPSSKLCKQLFLILQNRLRQASQQPSNVLLTVEELALRLLTPQEMEILIDGWNCWFENKDMNARIFFKSFDQEGEYLYLHGGLKQIIKEGWRKFTNQLHNINIVDITQNENQTKFILTSQDQQTIICDHLYVCIGLEHLGAINWNEFQTSIQLYASLGATKSSMRYYLIFEEPFQVPMDYVVGRILGHWWIKETDQIWMIYTDGELADELNELTDEQIVSAFCQEMKEMFGVDCPKLKKQIRGYWPTAFEVLMPSYFTNYKMVKQQLPFLITSLPLPEDQAWMNGHLYPILK